MSFLDLAQSRRSIRSFTDQEVSSQDVETLLLAAQAAPSGGNCQPWHFYVIRDRDTRVSLAEKSTRQPFIAAAPVVIVVCADPSLSAKRYSSRGKTLYCIQDTAAGIQNILLCAKSLGLGTCWCGAFDEKIVSEILSLPPHLRPIAMIPVGYPTNQPPDPTPRRPLDEITTFIV